MMKGLSETLDSPLLYWLNLVFLNSKNIYVVKKYRYGGRCRKIEMPQ